MKLRPGPCALAAWVLSTAAFLPMLTGPASAQLAHPWPMFRHDVCHTGQSPNPGPKFTSVGPAAADVRKWTGYDKIRTSPALSKDGKTLYFGMGFDVCAVDTGTMMTKDCSRLRADVSDSSPAVSADGDTIYIGDRDNTLTALTVNPEDGQLDLKWRHNRGFEGDIWNSVAIAPAGVPEAGTLYFAHDQTHDGVGMFTALIDKPDVTTVPVKCEGLTPASCGPYTVKWIHKIGNAVRQSSPAIDRNGIIYLGDLAGYLHAFRDNGDDVEECWSMKLSSAPGITASPVISPDSKTLYIGTTGAVLNVPNVPNVPMGLTAIDISDPACPSAPPIKWTFATTANFEGFGTGGKVDQPPALAHDGKTLYVPVMNGGYRSLYAVSDTGAKKWRFGPINWGTQTSGHPIAAPDGTVYVALGTAIYHLSSAGSQIWKYATTNSIESSPLIGPSINSKAVLYVPSRDHNIYAISGPPSGTAKPTTCWSAVPTGNQPPVANAGPDRSVLVDQVVTFDGSLSYDPNGTPLTALTFTWNFGVGEGGVGPCLASSSACVKPTHTYAQVNPDLSGYYTATLTVSDGQASDSDSVRIAVATSAGGTNNFTDNFDRADSTSLGSKWTGTTGLVIHSKQLNNTLRGDNIATVANLTGADQSASADFSSGDNNTGPNLGVLLRHKDAKNHYRLYRSVGGASQLRISKVVNGIEYPIKWVNIANPAVKTPFHLVGSVVGSILKLKMGGMVIEAPTPADTTFAGEAIGVLVKTGPPGTHTADNFCAAVGTGTCP